MTPRSGGRGVSIPASVAVLFGSYALVCAGGYAARVALGLTEPRGLHSCFTVRCFCAFSFPFSKSGPVQTG
jgi:hypothetical protein